jgi:hypothetical protein
MAASDDDPIASWHDRVGTLRKRGRVSGAALAVVPADDIDVRLGRPPAPEPLFAEERELWERLTFGRRPGWFTGAEAILESYVVTVTQRQAVALTASLATKLKLVPSSRLDRRTPQDGELPVA